MKKQRGFTLIELLMTLTIVAVLLAAGIPNFRTFLVKRSVLAAIDAFVTDVRYARSEALKRSSSVTVCRSADGATCSGAAGAWSDGWIIFLDTDGDGTLDSGEEILRVQSAPSGVGSIASLDPSSDRPFFSYAPNGLSISASQTFIFSPSGSVPLGTTRLVCVSNQGRAAVKAANASAC